MFIIPRAQVISDVFSVDTEPEHITGKIPPSMT